MTCSAAAFTIEPVSQGGLDTLLPLMRAYHDFYAVAPTDRDLRILTVELLAADGRHGLQLIARDRLGEAVGFVTLLFIRSTTSAALAAVMNDLYIGPAARGVGVAEALIDRCASESVQHGAAKLTWITRPDNHRAQAVYDQRATRDPWITYRIDLRNSTPTWR
jgi:ribosomal protein S18 acetylase RimI-like enzyme